MKYEIEKSKGGVKIDFELSADEWEQQIEKAYQKNKVKFNVPGFRKGHATRKIIEKMYGEGVFFDDAINGGFYDSYTKALNEHEDLIPVEEPNVEIKDIGDGIKFTATVTIKPEVKLGEYKGIKLPAVEYNVTDKDVEAEIKKAAERLSRKVKVEGRAAKEGDIVNINYSGSVDGEKFAGGTAENYDLTLGSNTFIPGFEEQVVGMNEGDTKDVKVKFPEDYHAKELAGKEAVFEVKANSITEKQLPEINDELAKDASKFDNLKDYKEDIYKSLKAEADRKAENEKESALLNAVTANAEVEIPEVMVEQQIDYIAEDMAQRLAYMYGGLKFEDYLKYTGSDMAKFRESKKEEALKDVKTRLTVEAIIKAENIDVTAEEIDAEIKKIAENAKKDFEEYKKTLDFKRVNYIANELVMKKFLEFLKGANSFDGAAAEENAPETEEKKSAKKPAAKKTSKKAE